MNCVMYDRLMHAIPEHTYWLLILAALLYATSNCFYTPLPAVVLSRPSLASGLEWYIWPVSCRGPVSNRAGLDCQIVAVSTVKSGRFGLSNRSGLDCQIGPVSTVKSIGSQYSWRNGAAY